MQCKDIPDLPILEHAAKYRGGIGIGWHDLVPREAFIPTVRDAMPDGLSDKLVLAKMRQLVKRGLVDGCTCGCRGDFEITEKGLEMLRQFNIPTDERVDWTILAHRRAKAIGSALMQHKPENDQP